MCENSQLVELQGVRIRVPPATEGCHIFVEAQNVAWCLAGAEPRFGGHIQRLAPAIAELEKRPDLNLYGALVVGRLACVALCVSAAVTGSSLLAWFSVPVLLWTLLVVWGQRVVFLENLNSLPRIAPPNAESRSALRDVSRCFGDFACSKRGKGDRAGRAIVGPTGLSVSGGSGDRRPLHRYDPRDSATPGRRVFTGACAASACFARRMGRKTACHVGSAFFRPIPPRRVVVIYLTPEWFFIRTPCAWRSPTPRLSDWIF